MSPPRPAPWSSCNSVVVSPGTGETPGMIAYGYDQGMVGYLTDVTGIAFNMVQALESLKDCDQKTIDTAW